MMLKKNNLKKQSRNYLDYIPVIHPGNTWEQQKNGGVTIHMVHRGFFAWIAQTLFFRPHISHIDLDTIGSFLFCRIDGQRTIGDLAALLKDTFGTDAEPLYERLLPYMQTLYNNHLIDYKTGP